ncbi:hypothetical protein JTB14_019970 [Gonioctena quinquepunctata]|nr:hypothetical protein JTB14_019970 [Gonioctena quinquepunctata]
MLRKKKENRNIADRGCSKLRKIEGNPNITSKRLTIPPGFLALGVRSETIRKSSNKEHHKDSDFLLKENLNGLFNSCLKVNPVNVRRSERILKKKTAQEQSHSSVSDYYNSIINKRETIQSEDTPKNKERSQIQNRSKSVFREINERYHARTEYHLNNNFNFLTPPQDSPSPGNLKEVVDSKPKNIYSDFCKCLWRQLHINFGHKALLDCKSRIAAKITKINYILSGKINSGSIMASEPYTLSRSALTKVSSEEPNFEYIPRSQWVYNTPPRQKMYVPKAEECQMIPAVLCSTKKQINIYEMKPNIKVDLSNCSNREGIRCDTKFLNRVGSFEHKMDVDLGNNCESRRQYSSQLDGISTFKFHHTQPQPSGFPHNSSSAVEPIPEKPFISLVTRPTKHLKKESRLNNNMKRKLDQTNGSNDNLFSQPSSNHKSFNNFHNDESGCNNSSLLNNSQTPDFNFEFKKKLFNGTEARELFTFDKEKTKLFDFSQ